MKRSCTCSNLRELEEYKGSAAEFDLDEQHFPRVKRQNSGLPRLMGSASVSGGLGFKHSPLLAPHHHRPLDTAVDGPLGLPPRSPTASPRLQPQQPQPQPHHQGLLARVESARLEFSVAAASCALAATSVPGAVVTTKAAVLVAAASSVLGAEAGAAPAVLHLSPLPPTAQAAAPPLAPAPAAAAPTPTPCPLRLGRSVSLGRLTPPPTGVNLTAAVVDASAGGLSPRSLSLTPSPRLSEEPRDAKAPGAGRHAVARLRASSSSSLLTAATTATASSGGSSGGSGPSPTPSPLCSTSGVSDADDYDEGEEEGDDEYQPRWRRHAGGVARSRSGGQIKLEESPSSSSLTAGLSLSASSSAASLPLAAQGWSGGSVSSLGSSGGGGCWPVTPTAAAGGGSDPQTETLLSQLWKMRLVDSSSGVPAPVVEEEAGGSIPRRRWLKGKWPQFLSAAPMATAAATTTVTERP